MRKDTKGGRDPERGLELAKRPGAVGLIGLPNSGKTAFIYALGLSPGESRGWRITDPHSASMDYLQKLQEAGRWQNTDPKAPARAFDVGTFQRAPRSGVGRLLSRMGMRRFFTPSYPVSSADMGGEYWKIIAGRQQNPDEDLLPKAEQALAFTARCRSIVCIVDISEDRQTVADSLLSMKACLAKIVEKGAKTPLPVSLVFSKCDYLMDGNDTTVSLPRGKSRRARFLESQKNGAPIAGETSYSLEDWTDSRIDDWRHDRAVVLDYFASQGWNEFVQDVESLEANSKLDLRVFFSSNWGRHIEGHRVPRPSEITPLRLMEPLTHLLDLISVRDRRRRRLRQLVTLSAFLFVVFALFVHPSFIAHQLVDVDMRGLEARVEAGQPIGTPETLVPLDRSEQVASWLFRLQKIGPDPWISPGRLRGPGELNLRLARLLMASHQHGGVKQLQRASECLDRAEWYGFLEGLEDCRRQIANCKKKRVFDESLTLASLDAMKGLPAEDEVVRIVEGVLAKANRSVRAMVTEKLRIAESKGNEPGKARRDDVRPRAEGELDRLESLARKVETGELFHWDPERPRPKDWYAPVARRQLSRSQGTRALVSLMEQVSKPAGNIRIFDAPMHTSDEALVTARSSADPSAIRDAREVRASVRAHVLKRLRARVESDRGQGAKGIIEVGSASHIQKLNTLVARTLQLMPEDVSSLLGFLEQHERAVASELNRLLEALERAKSRKVAKEEIHTLSKVLAQLRQLRGEDAGAVGLALTRTKLSDLKLSMVKALADPRLAGLPTPEELRRVAVEVDRGKESKGLSKDTGAWDVAEETKAELVRLRNWALDQGETVLRARPSEVRQWSRLVLAFGDSAEDPRLAALDVHWKLALEAASGPNSGSGTYTAADARSRIAKTGVIKTPAARHLLARSAERLCALRANHSAVVLVEALASLPESHHRQVMRPIEKATLGVLGSARAETLRRLIRALEHQRFSPLLVKVFQECRDAAPSSDKLEGLKRVAGALVHVGFDTDSLVREDLHQLQKKLMASNLRKIRGSTVDSRLQELCGWLQLREASQALLAVRQLESVVRDPVLAFNFERLSSGSLYLQANELSRAQVLIVARKKGPWGDVFGAGEGSLSKSGLPWVVSSAQDAVRQARAVGRGEELFGKWRVHGRLPTVAEWRAVYGRSRIPKVGSLPQGPSDRITLNAAGDLVSRGGNTYTGMMSGVREWVRLKGGGVGLIGGSYHLEGRIPTQTTDFDWLKLGRSQVKDVGLRVAVDAVPDLLSKYLEPR